MHKKYFYSLSFAVFGILLHLFYSKTMGGGFVFDMTEWLNDYILHPNFDIFHPPFDNNLRPVYHFILYNTFKTFGVHPKAWYLLSLGFYFICSCTILVFFERLFSLVDIPNQKILAFLCSLAFVLTPFGSEVAVWHATIHYLVVLIALFLSLILLVLYSDRLLYISVPLTVFFIIAILSIELSYSIIPICLITFLFIKYLAKTTSSLKQYILWILVPHLFVFLVYNSISAIYYDKFLGHYNIGKVDFGWTHLFMHYIKLFFKHLSLVNFFGQSIYEATFIWMDNFTIPLVLIFICVLCYFLWKAYSQKFKLSAQSALKWYFFLASGCLYIPISFLFFHNWKEVELDRLGLPMMIFGSALFLVSIFDCLQGWKRHIVLFYFFGASIMLLHDYTGRWQKSALVRKNFSESLPYHENKNVFIVGVPIVMQYVYLFAINDSAELHRQLRIFQKVEPKGRYQILGFYNMQEIDDVVTATKIDSLTIHFALQKWGNWCWHNLKSAIQAVENEKYTLTPDADNLGYTVKFKSLTDKDKLLIFNRLHFSEIRLDSVQNGHVFL